MISYLLVSPGESASKRAAGPTRLEAPGHDQSRVSLR